MKTSAVDELMMFLKPDPDERRVPLLKIWDLARLIEPFATHETGGFSGLSALRCLLECREAWIRAWRLEVMRPMSEAAAKGEP